MNKVAMTKTGNTEKRRKKIEKMATSEKLTNGFMLTLTYGLVAIILLEIVRRQYMVYMSRFDMGALEFASMFCIICGIIFAVGAGVVAILGGFKKISLGRTRNYTIAFVVSSLVSFFLSYDVRLPISVKLFEGTENGIYEGFFDFLANLNLMRDAQMIEYGVIGFIVIAFIVYAVRLALLERKK